MRGYLRINIKINGLIFLIWNLIESCFKRLKFKYVFFMNFINMNWFRNIKTQTKYEIEGEGMDSSNFLLIDEHAINFGWLLDWHKSRGS